MLRELGRRGSALPHPLELSPVSQQCARQKAAVLIETAVGMCETRSGPIPESFLPYFNTQTSEAHRRQKHGDCVFSMLHKLMKPRNESCIEECSMEQRGSSLEVDPH